MSELINRYEALRDASQIAIRESETLEGMMEQVLTKVVHESIKKYQQKVSAGVEDSVADLLDDFKQKVTRTIFDVASTWKVENREPVLFPKGCRFAYTRGESTIFVIEQDPAIRSVLFDFGVTGESKDEGEEGRLSLAFPYVLFIAHFKTGQFSGLYTGWRTAPLRTLNDMISRPVLPNVHDSLNVCMDFSHGRGETMSEATMDAVSNFWNSRFNNDVSDHWWKKSSISPKMRSGHTWERESQEDSMWVLGLDYPHQKSLQQAIDLLVMYEMEPDENAFRHVLADGVDSSVRTLFSKVSRYFKKTKFDKYHPKDVTEPLKDAIIEAVGEFSDVVFSLDKEICDLSQDLKREKRPLIKKGNFWTEYVP